MWCYACPEAPCFTVAVPKLSLAKWGGGWMGWHREIPTPEHLHPTGWDVQMSCCGQRAACSSSSGKILLQTWGWRLPFVG